MEVREIKVKRKFINRLGQSRMLSIPPFFLDAMGALDSKEVVISIMDHDHLVLQIIRGGDKQ